MSKTTTAIQTINASADAVWATIAQGGDVHKWFGSAFRACELKGSGEGAERILTLADGGQLRERIVEIDHAAKRFRYAIEEHPLPATNVVGRIEVEDLGGGKTEVRWGATYTVADEHVGVVEQALMGVYGQGIRALEAYCGQAA